MGTDWVMRENGKGEREAEMDVGGGEEGGGVAKVTRRESSKRKVGTLAMIL